MRQKIHLPVLFHCPNSEGQPERLVLAGSVLVVAIWMVTILVIFVVSLSALVSGRLNSFKYFRDTNRASLIAYGAVNKTIAELNKEAKSSYFDTLSESWSNSPELFQEIKLGGGTATVSYQYPQMDGEPITFYGCADEEQRININRAVTSVFVSLFTNTAGLTAEDALKVACAVIDWRDADSIVRPDSGEDDYYMSLSPPYHCKNGNFDLPEELLLVKGMTPEIYSKIKDNITVYGTGGRVNINTAPANTLLALGLPEALVKKIYRFRAGADATLGTKDDNVITQSSELVNKLEASGALTAEEINLLNNLIVQDLITVESKYFRIKAKGTINNKSREITCIIQRGGSIIFWHEM